MKKYGSMFFLAIAMMIFIAVLAACMPTDNQHEAPAMTTEVGPTYQYLLDNHQEADISDEEYAQMANQLGESMTKQPEYIPPVIDLLANSTQSGSTGNCSSGRDGNRIWVSHIGGKSFSIEYVNLLDPTMIVLPETGSGDAVRREFSIANDFILMDISTSKMSVNGQAFIKLLCFESEKQYMHVQYDVYVEYGLYYFVLQEETGRFSDSYIWFMPDSVKFIAVDTIAALEIDPINRRPNGTSNPQP